MSSTALSFVSPATTTTTSSSCIHVLRNVVVLSRKAIPGCRYSTPSSISRVFLRYPCGGHRRTRYSAGANKPFSPVMQWQDCTVKMEIDVPISVAYNCYSDREAIPRWMPFISTVKILEDKPDLSRWSLKYKAFGRDIEFSWLARNMQPIPNQKIHWRSLEGLPNRHFNLFLKTYWGVVWKGLQNMQRAARQAQPSDLCSR
ncbi:hypothetical protein RJ640_021682 [Escallonia rubra]|uniref:Coenzyme Q-binding protein COQ10 START domain-containing protein n=1 Tax=Escallonia rubra TaxID=112253 RepID=A0AA88U680_9ASTE|nr:hypothetical protein RJ640_021682 [Escallonia rubra]